MNQIIMLGTGNATVTQCYNTCFLLETSTTRLLVEQADWLMAEAFCLYADRETFKPYEKSHSTALDAGRLASELGVRHLILYHTEEKTLATRKVAYAQEAAQQYDGPVLVPDDLEVIPLD